MENLVKKIPTVPFPSPFYWVLGTGWHFCEESNLSKKMTSHFPSGNGQEFCNGGFCWIM